MEDDVTLKSILCAQIINIAYHIIKAEKIASGWSASSVDSYVGEATRLLERLQPEILRRLSETSR